MNLLEQNTSLNKSFWAVCVCIFFHWSPLNAQSGDIRDTVYITFPIKVIIFDEVMKTDFIERNFIILSNSYETKKIAWYGDSIMAAPSIEKEIIKKGDTLFIKFKKEDVFGKFFTVSFISKETWNKYYSFAEIGDVTCKIDSIRNPEFSLELRLSAGKKKNEICSKLSFITIFTEKEKRENVIGWNGWINIDKKMVKKKHLGKQILSEIEKIAKASKKMTRKRNKM